jgi:hypothetical protein
MMYNLLILFSETENKLLNKSTLKDLKKMKEKCLKTKPNNSDKTLLLIITKNGKTYSPNKIFKNKNLIDLKASLLENYPN